MAFVVGQLEDEVGRLADTIEIGFDVDVIPVPRIVIRLGVPLPIVAERQRGQRCAIQNAGV